MFNAMLVDALLAVMVQRHLLRKAKAEKMVREEAVKWEQKSIELVTRLRLATIQKLRKRLANTRATQTADKRLNHLIKGNCGCAISMIEISLLNADAAHSFPEEAIQLPRALKQLEQTIVWANQREVRPFDGSLGARKADGCCSVLIFDALLLVGVHASRAQSVPLVQIELQHLAPAEATPWN